VDVEDSDGRVGQEGRRFVVVHARQLAQQQAHTYAMAQAKEAERVTAHRQRVEARRFACAPDADAAISPVWLEKPERITALALLTVVGLLVDAVIQRQVRLSLRTPDQHVPGNIGETAIPPAAGVLSLFAPVAVVQIQRGNTTVQQRYGVHPHHRMICDALGLDRAWYDVPPA
jgi:hypothetical protein